MDYKDYMQQMVDLPKKKLKKELVNSNDNSIIENIKDDIQSEFNLFEILIYDKNASKPKTSPKMIEMIKRQMRGMQGYKLSRVYETKGSYRMVFESDQEGNFEISIRETK